MNRKLTNRRFPFYDYLKSLSRAGKFKESQINRFYDAAKDSLSALGLDFDSVTIEDIDANIHRFKAGGDLNTVQQETHYCRSALLKLRDYLGFGIFDRPLTDPVRYRDLPFLGPDNNTRHVQYEDRIPQERRVPGLTEYLEAHYDDIVRFTADIIGRDDSDKILVILDEERPFQTFPFDAKAWILRQWDVYQKRGSAYEIIDILRIAETTTPVLGNYYPKERIIRIHYTNTYRENKREYFAQMEGCLAHEHMHFLHHSLLGDQHFCVYTSTAKVIQESIADFSSYRYLFTRNNKYARTIAEEKLSGWKRYFGSGYPYAESYWFFHINGQFFPSFSSADSPEWKTSGDKLQEVISASEYTYDIALGILRE